MHLHRRQGEVGEEMETLRRLVKRLFDPVDHEKVTTHHNNTLQQIQMEMTGIRTSLHPYRGVRSDRDCLEKKGGKDNGHRSSKTD